MRYQLAALILIIVGWSSSSVAEPSHGAVDKALAEGVIMPAYRHYAEAMHDLGPAVTDLCGKPGDETLAGARTAFVNVLDAWQHLEPIAFGPIEDGGLAARIHFWPDKHGTAGKQLSRLLAKPDPKALEGGVAGKSAALQSLSALERLLFGDVDMLNSDQSAFACGLAMAIADFQRALADDILAAWEGDKGHGALFAQADGGNDAYYDPADAMTDLFASLGASLDAIVVSKLEQPLGRSLEGAKPKQAEDWRSGRSLANIIANLETIRALYVLPGGLNVWLPAKNLGALDQTIKKGLDQTIRTAASIDSPLDQAVENEAARVKVDQLLNEVISLRALFTGTLADAAGLTLGFNKSDGD